MRKKRWGFMIAMGILLAGCTAPLSQSSTQTPIVTETSVEMGQLKFAATSVSMYEAVPYDGEQLVERLMNQLGANVQREIEEKENSEEHIITQGDFQYNISWNEQKQSAPIIIAFTPAGDINDSIITYFEREVGGEKTRRRVQDSQAPEVKPVAAFLKNIPVALTYEYDVWQFTKEDYQQTQETLSGLYDQGDLEKKPIKLLEATPQEFSVVDVLPIKETIPIVTDPGYIKDLSTEPPYMRFLVKNGQLQYVLIFALWDFGKVTETVTVNPEVIRQELSDYFVDYLSTGDIVLTEVRPIYITIGADQENADGVRKHHYAPFLQVIGTENGQPLQLYLNAFTGKVVE